MFTLLKKINLLNIPFIKKMKDKLWHLVITSPYQRQIEGKEYIINKIEEMRKEKISLWKKRKQVITMVKNQKQK
jgi:hypothetical protein